jgi:hypothetical protein
MYKQIYRKARLAGRYVDSLINAPKQASEFNDVETFCVFIGYPRSGHSLVCSLLDAHPEIVISNELSVFRYLKYGFSRQQIYYLILQNSRSFASRGNVHTGYSYRVENQWQGRYSKIRVIGDKRGGGNVKKMYYRPQLFDRLYETVGVAVKFVHSIRNPFDNISTLYVRSEGKQLAERADRYFFLVDEVNKLKQKVSPEDVFDLRHEAFILKPQETLKELTSFLGVESDPSYLNDCASILFKTPKKTRLNVTWSDDLIQSVQERIDRYPFLAGYHYHD